MSDRDPRATLLRRVDGVPHLILGPLLLVARAPLERVTGVSQAALSAVLVPFTAYGVVVVAGTQKPRGPMPPWLLSLAATANAGAVVVGSAAATHRGLTPLGRFAGGGLALGGASVPLGRRGLRT